MRVAVVTAAVPFLGGPQTWTRLAEALPPGDTIDVVDPLDASAGDAYVSLVRAITGALAAGADVLVAHGGALRPSLEALAKYHRDVPLVALAPIYAGGSVSISTNVTNWVLGSRPGSMLLARFAKRYYERMRESTADRVRSQLEILVRDDAIDAALVAEASARLADPRTVARAERIASFVRADTVPIPPELLAAAPRRVALVGEGTRTRRSRANLIDDDWTIIEVNGDAPMLEDPFAVVRAIRSFS